MKKWEYKTLVVEVEQLEEQLPELGAQGWELVGMVTVPIKHEKGGEGETVIQWETHAYRLVFKRRQQ
jgi:hypothetical protein